MGTLRSFAKAGAELLALGAGSAPGRLRTRGRTLVLAYHNVVPADRAMRRESPLHLPFRRFAEQLDVLAEAYEVVPLDAILRNSQSGKPRIAITFDDAYCGAVTAGVEELVRRGLPATIFIAPRFVGGYSFWWDALAEGGEGELPPSMRSYALCHMRGDDAAVRSWAGRSGYAVTEPAKHARCATVEQLRLAACAPNITLAAHGWSHRDLSSLSAMELEEELVRPLEWLQQRFPSVIPWISYPYGLCSPTVERAAAEAGYRAGLLVTGGWVPRRDPPLHRLPRFNVGAGLSSLGFRLRLSGVLTG